MTEEKEATPPETASPPAAPVAAPSPEPEARPAATPPEASAESAASPRRRARRRRQVDDDRPAGERASGGDRSRRRRRRKKPDEKATDDGGVRLTHGRTVFRQDPIDLPPPGPDKPKLAVAKMPDKTKVTLLLHPAPKAAQKGAKKKKEPLTAKQALKAKTRGKGTPKADKSSHALDAAWVSATGDAAVDALVAAGNTAGEALVKRWVADDNVDAIAHAGNSDRPSGKARKAARRALGALKSRGVALPEVAPDAKPTAASSPEAEASPVATFIPPDASGVSFISISKRLPGGRYMVADAVVQKGRGVIQVTSGRIAGKQIRNWKQRVEKQFGAAPVEIPVDWARHRIAEARKENTTSGEIVPLGFDKAQVLFAPIPDAPPPHPVAELVADPDAQTLEKAVLDSDKLHSEPEFRTWVPERAVIDEMLGKVSQALDEEAAKDPEKINAALEEEIKAACDRFFTPERRERTVELMHDAAISIRARHGDDQAKRVLHLGEAVKRAGLITQPPREIPFLVGYFRKAVAMSLAEQGRAVG